MEKKKLTHEASQSIEDPKGKNKRKYKEKADRRFAEPGGQGYNQQATHARIGEHELGLGKAGESSAWGSLGKEVMAHFGWGISDACFGECVHGTTRLTQRRMLRHEWPTSDARKSASQNKKRSQGCHVSGRRRTT